MQARSSEQAEFTSFYKLYGCELALARRRPTPDIHRVLRWQVMLIMDSRQAMLKRFWNAVNTRRAVDTKCGSCRQCMMVRTGCLSLSKAEKSGAMAREWMERRRARDATRRARPLSWAPRRTQGRASPSWAPRSSRGGDPCPSGSSETQINTVQYIPTVL